MWTEMIVLEMMLRRLWEIYAVPQIASIRSTYEFWIRAAQLTAHWMWAWIYHHRGASHAEKNAVWNDVIGTDGVQHYIARHSRGWTGPRHAAPA